MKSICIKTLQLIWGMGVSVQETIVCLYVGYYIVCGRHAGVNMIPLSIIS